MIQKRITERLAIILLVAVLLLSFLLPRFASATGRIEQTYEQALFGPELISIDIQMEQADWTEMLDNALSETYYACDVTINGQTFSNVGIRPKGNTSLTQVEASDSDRYSFKLEFDHYQDGQTCWGLDKLVLNNLISDATYLKEYLTYDMFSFLDMPSSAYGMAEITVNGQPWGIYLALEGVEESFLMRWFGTSAGDLYKPENMGMGQKPEGDRQQKGENAPPDRQMPDDMTIPEDGPANRDFNAPNKNMELPENMPDRSTMPQGMRPEKNGFGASGGSDLKYTDDNLDSYETIWQGQVTDTDDADHNRVVQALQKISTGDLDGVDVDLLCKYMAVQTFVVNLDSLTGNMAHNYYLYEQDGKLALLPWDYNLAFGGFGSGDASSMINFPIDTPVSGVSLEDRPIFSIILQNQQALALYHDYLYTLCTDYVQGGHFLITYTTLRGLLDDRVASEDHDPTAFYSNDDYLKAIEMLRTVIEKRAQSIVGQLQGEIPATTEQQQAQPDALLDTTGIDLRVMGVQQGGARQEKFNTKQAIPTQS